MPNTLEDAVAAHYAVTGLREAIDAGLDATGTDRERPTVEALAPVDEFHTAGRKATVQALALMRLRPGMRILDAGCGIGGTARCLAAEHGCEVVGIDLTPEFVRIAGDLTRRMGLAQKCSFVTGSVLELPFSDTAFDGAVSFHVAMNIEDRDRFYGEIARVLQPGAQFCIFDVMKGPTPGVQYPMPWAETPATSFLKTRDETVGRLRANGFEIDAERNMRDFANDYFARLMASAATADGPPPLGLHLLTGADTEAKFANVIAAYKAHQTEPVIIVARKR